MTIFIVSWFDMSPNWTWEHYITPFQYLRTRGVIGYFKYYCCTSKAYPAKVEGHIRSQKQNWFLQVYLTNYNINSNLPNLIKLGYCLLSSDVKIPALYRYWRKKRSSNLLIIKITKTFYTFVFFSRGDLKIQLQVDWHLGAMELLVIFRTIKACSNSKELGGSTSQQ